MVEIEPASDELVAAAEAEANEVLANVIDGPVEIYAIPLRAILARLRAEQARSDKAEAELARLKSAIAEADKHAPESVHFIRAMASTQ